jgi:hypothetical protein
VFVIITGLFGLLLGQVLLARLPLRMRIARGAPYGAAAHGFGLRARAIGPQEGGRQPDHDFQRRAHGAAARAGPSSTAVSSFSLNTRQALQAATEPLPSRPILPV